MANTYSQIYHHYIFAVQHRACLIQPDWKEELYKYMTGVHHHHVCHPRHEERQQEEDDGVTEGVAHAVVEELHPRFGPEEFRGNVQRPIRETKNKTRERKPAREDIDVHPDADVVEGELRQQEN